MLPIVGRELPKGWRVDARGNLLVWESVIHEQYRTMTEIIRLARRHGCELEYHPYSMEYGFVPRSTPDAGTLATQTKTG